MTLVVACAASRPSPQRAASAQLTVQVTAQTGAPPGSGTAAVPQPLTAGALGERANGNAPQADSDRIPVGTSPVRGRGDALVTIVEFSDFQCPFCGRVESTLREVRERYGDDVRLVWKNNPLPFHSDAAPAAEAALAAGAQGRFWEMHDMLYENQRALSRADLERYATYLGLDMGRFRADLDNHTFVQQVQEDQALAQRLNAQGTPYFFVNGTQLVGAQPVERFTTLIDSVLATARLIAPRNLAYARMTAAPLPSPDPAPSPSAPTPSRRAELDPTTTYRVPVGHSPTLGPANALVTIVEFSDFQCPFCSRVEPTLRTLRQQYGNDVRIVWKNQPLAFHDHAMPAAEAAMEAFAQRGNDGFWRYHDALYQHQADQGGLDRQALETYAQQLGLNMARFRSALDQHTHRADIAADVALATQVAANGTPHFFVNGRRLVGAQPLERFTTLVDEMRTVARGSLHGAAPTARLYDAIIAQGVTAPVYLPTPGDQGPDTVYTITPNARAPFRGGAHARVVIEHFADFQCPFCSRVSPAIDQIVRTYGDRVRVVWRDYPLPFHTNAMPAAEAAREVLAQRGNDAFWRFHDLLFANQRDLERADLERYAMQLQVDMARFRSALDQHTHAAGIRADIAAADASHAEMGTPATFINGHFVSGAQPFDEFQRVIDAALQGHPTAQQPTAPAPPPAPVPPPTAQGERIGASHILVMYAGSSRAPQTVTRSRDEARARAAEVLRRARGGEDFADLARNFSDEPGAGPRGGDLGVFGRGMMVPAFEAGAFALSVGEISEIVETPFGFHVIRRNQ